VLKSHQIHKGLGQSGEENRAHEGPRHSTGESEMIIRTRELAIYIICWCPIYQHIVCCLDVERLLDLCVWRNNKVDQDQRRKQENQSGISPAVSKFQ